LPAHLHREPDTCEVDRVAARKRPGGIPTSLVMLCLGARWLLYHTDLRRYVAYARMSVLWLYQHVGAADLGVRFHIPDRGDAQYAVILGELADAATAVDRFSAAVLARTPSEARRAMAGKHVLVFGYHGFRNAGAESRLVSIVHALRELVEGDHVHVVTFHRHHLDYLGGVRKRYLHPAFYKVGARRLLRDVDMVVFTEGNMLSDAFTKHMVLAHTTVLEQAAEAGVPAAALAIDSGPLHASRRPRVMAALNILRLLTVRTPAALDELRERGLAIPVTVTADCAVSMPLPSEAVRATVTARLDLHAPRIHGLAPVDFFMYPARMALAGRPGEYVRYPFKGTWPNGGRARSERLVDQWAAFGAELAARDPECALAVVVMDPSDKRIGLALRAALVRRVGDPRRVRLVSCLALDTVQMSAALSRLTTMVTSRYHALVMPLAYAVPFVAVGHDNRTRFITQEMGVERYFVQHDTPELAGVLADRHRQLMAERDELRPALTAMFADFQERDRENYRLLATVVKE
jgi:polysaccharide pyruvyl transferase WcaK-like protein